MEMKARPNPRGGYILFNEDVDFFSFDSALWSLKTVYYLQEPDALNIIREALDSLD